ncbi:MAG: DNA polymerase III subunit delta [Wenzhouxiangellaceae bacterium]|nr:DNA polymerase III subunit delta [Wenzhouxiangellaceae bacterium]
MKLFAERLPGQLAKGLAPVYLIAGPERLLVEEAADQVRKACRERQITERIRLAVDGRFKWSELGQATETGSLFATRRLVEIRLPTGKPGAEGAKVLRQWLEHDHDDILLILCDQWELAQERAAWLKAIEKQGVYVPAWNIKAGQLARWLSQRLKSRNLEADSHIAAFLAERLEGNLLAAAQEVDRLALLYPRQRLDMQKVRAAVADNARFDSFRLVELVLGGQAGAALRCIRGLREIDTPPPAVLWALGRELEAAAMVAQRSQSEPVGRVFDDLKVWRSRQAPIQACIHRNGPRRLQQAVALLSRLDLLSKGQAHGDFWLELEQLCVRIAAPSDRAA